MDERSGGREGDAVTLLASRQPQCQGDMGFARAGGTESDAVLALLDPFAARQFENQRFVERGLRGEVESVEALDLCEPRRMRRSTFRRSRSMRSSSHRRRR